MFAAVPVRVVTALAFIGTDVSPFSVLRSAASYVVSERVRV